MQRGKRDYLILHKVLKKQSFVNKCLKCPNSLMSQQDLLQSQGFIEMYVPVLQIQKTRLIKKDSMDVAYSILLYPVRSTRMKQTSLNPLQTMQVRLQHCMQESQVINISSSTKLKISATSEFKPLVLDIMNPLSPSQHLFKIGEVGEGMRVVRPICSMGLTVPPYGTEPSSHKNCCCYETITGAMARSLPTPTPWLGAMDMILLCLVDLFTPGLFILVN